MGTFYEDWIKLIYIAMEECHHQNLQDYVQSQIRATVPFDADKYLSYSYQIAVVMEFLHQHKIAVGSLKQDAILLSMDKATIKICDFDSQPTRAVAQNIHDVGLTYHFLWSYGSDGFCIPNSTSARSLMELMTARNPSDRPTSAEVVRHDIFKHFRGKVSLESKNTSTGYLLPSDTAGSEEMLIDAKSGVVTRFHNFHGGLAISKSLRKVIGSESEQLYVGNCLVAFTSESFTESTPVTVKAEIDSSKWPKNFTGYTPTLYVDAEGLKKKVRVKLPSWRVNNHSEKAEARILHIPKGSTEWEDTEVVLPVTDEPYFEFEWEDFSPIVIGTWFGSKAPTDYRIAGNVYVSDESEVSVAYHLNGGAGSDSMISEVVSKRMTSAKPPKHYKIGIDEFILKTDESIKTRISCENPTGLEFKPSDPFTFTADKHFGKKLFVEHHGAVLGNLTERQRIYLECSINKKSGEKIGNTAGFTCEWTPQIKLVEKPKQPEVLPSPAVTPSVNNVSVDLYDNRGQTVTAGKYVGQNAHVQSSESNTSNSGASTNQK